MGFEEEQFKWSDENAWKIMLIGTHLHCDGISLEYLKKMVLPD